MFLNAFTLIHVLISLVGIFTGLVVTFGFISSQLLSRWNTVFLVTTILTSVTGFFFPVKQFMPSHAVGILSLLLLTLALFALKRRQLAGGWRKIYALTVVTSLYLNMFVLVVQSFLKIPSLHQLAPTQTEPPFKLTQLTLLLVFILLGALATFRFRKPVS